MRWARGWIEVWKLFSGDSVYPSGEKKIKIRDKTIMARVLVELVWTPEFIDACFHILVFTAIRRAVCTKGLTLCPVVTIVDKDGIVVAGPDGVKYPVYFKVSFHCFT